MIFASSDVASVLHRWEVAEYVSEGFVIVGCAGELVADFFTRLPEKARKHIGSWSTIVLILALSVGLKCLIKTNELSGSVIGSLGEKAGQADTKAQTALVDSTHALAKAGEAETKSGNAIDKSDKADKSALNALRLARGARQEADSFEKDIKDTKRDAAESKTLLAEAQQLAAEAESRAANTERKIADRHISQAQQERIRRSLAKWDGMDIRLPITMVNGDDETWTYAGELLATLCAIPGWSAELDSLNNNSGASNLAVTVPEDAPTPDKSLAKDLVTALHDAGIEAKGPEPPPLAGAVMGGGRFRACGKLNPQHPTVDSSHPFNVKIEIQISRRL